MGLLFIFIVFFIILVTIQNLVFFLLFDFIEFFMVKGNWYDQYLFNVF